ncbi:hypothetical protein HYV86_01575 [Candidatus Woesearchaeota archaeon]|nr:hypothetical protein [Candidatus Woesearchaeota archaeon]
MENEQSMESQGGKRLHLQLLYQGGFRIPETFGPIDINLLDKHRLYVVRSSAAGEDGHTKTSAGKFLTLKGVAHQDLEVAILQVRSYYDFGSVVIQPDLSEIMQFSGVAYSNLNGQTLISGGRGACVQRIVEGESSETEVTFSGEKASIRGSPINPKFIREVCAKSREVEHYFGIPTDIEFAVIENEMTFLQARPLPNPTDAALREHERRRLNRDLQHLKDQGLDELVLGVGNYREILGNANATHLSASTFNYIFSGDGKEILGAVQLGRNELGYDLGTEIFPWTIMLNGKVYYNFAGDALQFRPKGISKEDLINVVNEIYLPCVRENPDLLNYPELRLYIQFPHQATQVGLDSEPFKELVARNRNAVEAVEIPQKPPLKKFAEVYDSIEACIGDITTLVDDIRVNSAKEYVKAARLAFFALEDVRMYIEALQREKKHSFGIITRLYGKESAEELRDAIVYDESIGSFELEDQEEFRYLGSFELSEPRGFPPKRHFKQGREIADNNLAQLISRTRKVLEYREKVKFTLFRDYDHLKQLYEQVGALSGLEKDVFYLDFGELSHLIDTPRLAMYRVELRKKIKDKKLLPDPLFGSDLESGNFRTYEKRPKLVFGSLPQQKMYVQIGKEGHIVDSVDQTIEIPNEARVVLVPDNVRPGSHLFTILSDYGLPVIGVAQEELDTIRNTQIGISMLKNGYVEIVRQDQKLE